MELNPEIAGTGAKVSVLQAFSVKEDGTESYFEKHQPNQTVDLETKCHDSTREETAHMPASSVKRNESKDENVVYPANSTLQFLQQ